MSYTGKYSTGLLSRNFGGIAKNASIVNLEENRAYDCVNWDLGLRGTIKRRKGWQQLATVGRLANPFALALFSFPDTDAVTRFVAIAYNDSGSIVPYQAASPSGPWTACAGSATFNATDPADYVGIPWKGKLYIVNGASAPVVVEYDLNAQTLEAASILSKPSRLNGMMTGLTNLTANFRAYGVAAITPRGKTDVITWPTPVFAGQYYDNLTTPGTGGVDGVTIFFTLSFAAVPGATAYEIYLYTQGTARGVSGLQSGAYVKIDQVPAGTTTWQDTAQTPAGMVDINGHYVYANTVNNAYNTPDWATSGYPSGGMVWGKGRAERLLLWRNSTIFGSGVEDPLTWWAQGDSIVMAVLGNGDTNIVAGSTLFDYLMFFSKRQCWVFAGSGPQDVSLVKNIPVGCAGPHAIVQVGADTYLMSQFGPTTFKRIIAGADVAAAHAWGDRVKPIMFEETNTSLWGRCFAYNDLTNSRVVWVLPKAGETLNGMALVYQYDTDSFAKYDSYPFIHVVEDSYNHYALTDVYINAVAQLHIGNTDNGTPITATYKTGWFDRNSWETTKRMTWVDVIANRALGAYTFNVQWDWDYSHYTSNTVTCTESTTDGNPIETTSSLANEHRIYTDGFGNAVQLILTTSAGDQQVEILGWLPDLRGKGLRKL